MGKEKEFKKARAESKDYTISNELLLLKIEEKVIPDGIRKLEEIFIEASNKICNLVFQIRKGMLKELSYDELCGLESYLIDIEQDLHKEDEKYFGFEEPAVDKGCCYNPDYYKFILYNVVALDEINDEIFLRKRMLGGS